MSEPNSNTASATEPVTDAGELDRLLTSARDALTDDIVSRVSATAADGIDLLDQVNRSGVAEALPTLARMVKNGDLERIAALARLVGSAEDALTDDMVSRLAEVTGTGLDLLDRVNRSGIERTLPAITQLVENGDLDRVIGLARLVGSAQDALSDDIISRLAHTAGELMCLVDRVARTPGFLRLLDLLGRDDIQDTLVNVLEGIGRAQQEIEKAPPSKGGFSGITKLARDPAVHDVLIFASAFGRQLRLSRN